MKTYQEMTLAERQAEYAALCRTHQEQKALGLDLNMARGKPGRCLLYTSPSPRDA